MSRLLAEAQQRGHTAKIDPAVARLASRALAYGLRACGSMDTCRSGASTTIDQRRRPRPCSTSSLRACRGPVGEERSAPRAPSARDLRLELVEAAELHLRPDELDQRRRAGPCRRGRPRSRTGGPRNSPAACRRSDGGRGWRRRCAMCRRPARARHRRRSAACRCSPSATLAVGKPMVRPRWSPSSTTPSISQEWPRSSDRLAAPSRRAAPRGCGSRNRSRPRASPDRAR